MLLFVAVGSSAVHGRSVVVEARSATNYWWNFTKSDCGYDDVAPQPPCGHAGKGDVAALKKCCLATTGCGGFNTNGIIKKTDCLLHKKAEPACDLYLLEQAPQPPPPPPSVNWPPIWPLPKQFSNGTVSLALAAGFRIVLGDNGTSSFLAAAITRYEKLMFAHATAARQRPEAALGELTLSVASLDDSHPQLGTDESYSLTIGPAGASLTSATVYGALHGLETFSQLVRFNFSSGGYYIPGSPWAISDAPRFPHRGLMVDTSRHFQTLASLRRVVDSLPYAKVNTLHWHMSDAQSFPLESKTAPRLWRGAYSPQERYTQADVAAVVEYARLRGVRVMVEFDVGPPRDSPPPASRPCLLFPELPAVTFDGGVARSACHGRRVAPPACVTFACHGIVTDALRQLHQA